MHDMNHRPCGRAKIAKGRPVAGHRRTAAGTSVGWCRTQSARAVCGRPFAVLAPVFGDDIGDELHKLALAKLGVGGGGAESSSVGVDDHCRDELCEKPP